MDATGLYSNKLGLTIVATGAATDWCLTIAIYVILEQQCSFDLSSSFMARSAIVVRREGSLTPAVLSGVLVDQPSIGYVD